MNAAVTPVGIPAAASVTLPVNPPKGLTVMVSVPLLPWATDRVAAEGVRVNPAVGLTVRVMLVLAVVVPEVPVMVIG